MISDLPGEECVDFTLKYSGPLYSAQATAAKRAKSHLRIEFDRQLTVLWSVHPVLRKEDAGRFERRRVGEGKMADLTPPVLYESELWRRCLVGGIDYVPLVTYGHRMHCHLAIRLHSRRAPGGIVHHGADLDNRLKALIDALRVPDPGQNTTQPESAGTEPLMYCLLEDDSLVTKLSIETFRLLKPEQESASHADANYAEVDIDVHVAPISPGAYNYPLLFP